MQIIEIKNKITPKKSHIILEEEYPMAQFDNCGKLISYKGQTIFKNKNKDYFLVQTPDKTIFLLKQLCIQRTCDKDLPISELLPSEIHESSLMEIYNVYKNGSWLEPLEEKFNSEVFKDVLQWFC